MALEAKIVDRIQSTLCLNTTGTVEQRTIERMLLDFKLTASQVGKFVKTVFPTVRVTHGKGKKSTIYEGISIRASSPHHRQQPTPNPVYSPFSLLHQPVYMPHQVSMLHQPSQYTAQDVNSIIHKYEQELAHIRTLNTSLFQRLEAARSLHPTNINVQLRSEVETICSSHSPLSIRVRTIEDIRSISTQQTTDYLEQNAPTLYNIIANLTSPQYDRETERHPNPESRWDECTPQVGVGSHKGVCGEEEKLLPDMVWVYDNDNIMKRVQEQRPGDKELFQGSRQFLSQSDLLVRVHTSDYSGKKIQLLRQIRGAANVEITLTKSGEEGDPAPCKKKEELVEAKLPALVFRMPGGHQVGHQVVLTTAENPIQNQPEAAMASWQLGHPTPTEGDSGDWTVVIRKALKNILHYVGEDPDPYAASVLSVQRPVSATGPVLTPRRRLAPTGQASTSTARTASDDNTGTTDPTPTKTTGYSSRWTTAHRTFPCWLTHRTDESTIYIDSNAFLTQCPTPSSQEAPTGREPQETNARIKTVKRSGRLVEATNPQPTGTHKADPLSMVTRLANA
ncbi:hypothetical protein Bbelb_291660 [Branchiostoma belcheri]|nr:hypothetical protein Bbelb_291660 [Branchiostoma belcheri]